MTTFTLTINGETKTYGYNPNEAAELRIYETGVLQAIKEVEVDYNAQKGSEKAKIGKALKSLKEERELVQAKIKDCPPDPTNYALTLEHTLIRSASAAWEAVDKAKAEIIRQMGDGLHNGEYVMRASEALVKAEIVAHVFAYIGEAQAKKSGQEISAKAASISVELFDAQIWREVLESMKRRFTQKLMQFRMPSSSSQTANIAEGLRYEAMANFLDGYYGYGEINYSLTRIEELIAIREWMEANPV